MHRLCMNEPTVLCREDIENTYRFLTGDHYVDNNSADRVYLDAHIDTYSTVEPNNDIQRIYLPPGIEDICLGHTIGWKTKGGCAILDDSWVVNLRSTHENIYLKLYMENIMDMNDLVNQMRAQCGCGDKKKIISVDVELTDLMKIYTDADKHFKMKMERAQSNLDSYMKEYLKCKDEYQTNLNKITSLKSKINAEPESEDDEDEGDDE